MNPRLMIAMLMLLCFSLTGCSFESSKGPTQDELTRGANIDLRRMSGMVDGTTVKYHNGDNEATKELKGKPYYCLNIRYKDEKGGTVTELFKGVPTEIFDLVKAGTQLPIQVLFTPKTLSGMEGRVIDKQCNLEKEEYYVVIDTLEDIVVGHVSKTTYYKRIDVGMKLPTDWKLDRGAKYSQKE